MNSDRTEQSTPFNTAAEMLSVIQALLDGEPLEFRCIAENSEINARIHDWRPLRNDLPAHQTFDFQHFAYRANETYCSPN